RRVARLLALLSRSLSQPAERVHRAAPRRPPGNPPEHAHEQILSCGTAGSEALSRDGSARPRGPPVRESRLQRRERRESSRVLVAAELWQARADDVAPHRNGISRGIRRSQDALPLSHRARDPPPRRVASPHAALVHEQLDRGASRLLTGRRRIARLPTRCAARSRWLSSMREPEGRALPAAAGHLLPDPRAPGCPRE